MKLCVTRIVLSGICFTIISCIVVLTVAFTIVPKIYNESIQQNFGLRNNNFQYNLFMEPFTLEYRIYFFHIVNKEGILNNEKPILMEIGPYIYRETRTKTVINSDNDTITYKEVQQFQFDSDASFPLTEQDNLTVLNIPLMHAYQMAEISGDEDLFKENFTKILQQNGLFLDIEVDKLLFTGFTFCEDAEMTQICSTLKDNRYIKKLDNGSFEFSFVKYRTSANNTLTVNRGIRNESELGEISSWNNHSYSIYWNNQTTCSRIRGTDSTLFPPDLDTDSVLRIFSTDAGTANNLTYGNDIVYKSMKGEMFQANSSNLWPHCGDLETNCYCTKLTTDENNKKQCYLDGILDFQSRTGAPVLLSFPHFLWADAKYRSAIDGVFPQEDLHRTYFIIEPNTGITLEGAHRSQLNTVLRPINVQNYTNISRAVLPLFWVEETWSLSETVAGDLNKYYFSKINQRNALEWGLVAISIFVAILLFVFILKIK